MKTLLLIIALVAFVTGQLYAQDNSYWVGVSGNSDPIVRRQEAFLNAFSQYARSRSPQLSDTDSPFEPSVQDSSYITYSMLEDGPDNFPLFESVIQDSCSFEIVSSTIDNGKETLTISVGKGTLVKYRFAESISEMNNEMQSGLLLDITYSVNSGDDKKAWSQHQYQSHYIEQKDASGHILKSTNEFKYECVNVESYE